MKTYSLKEDIIALFSGKTKTLQLNEIAKSLRIAATSPRYDVLKDTLNLLIIEGVLEKSTRRKYSLVKEIVTNEFIGIFRIIDDRAMIQPTSKEFPKITIKRKHFFTALDGDSVMVKLLASKKENKPQGEVINIVQRLNREIIGNIEFDGNFYFLVPDDEQYYVDFLIAKSKLKNAKEGDKVSARFLHWDDPSKSPQAEVVEILGISGEPEVEFHSVIREFTLPMEFPEKVIQEAKQVPSVVSKAEIERRLDLRKKTIITIDPDDAKDFDDALSLEKLENGNYLLGVHIADVSHYVTEHSQLDIEAVIRGNSTYLVDCVIPMLPEELSNEICSLKPNRVRLTYSVMMELSKTFTVKKYEIVESVIKSAKRFTYDEVQNIIETGKGKHSELVLELNKIANAVRANRFAGGGINFKTAEVRFKLDENKFPIEAKLKYSSDATQLVEECMLLANKTVAEHIKKISKKYKLKETLPFLYRVHADPVPDKLRDALEFIKLLGPKHNFVINSSKDINALLSTFEGRAEEAIVNQILVRSMPKAEYADDNIGHYGLGFEDYAHFTSPIRRYPDLLIHRLLKEYNLAKPEMSRFRKLEYQIKGLGEHCTQRERLSMEAERASSKLAQTMIASKNQFKPFTGTITGVQNYGVFVLLDEIFAEGLLHIKDIFDDYYFFDEKRLRLIGKRSGKIFYFGKKLKVRIVKTNIDKRKIDLEYISEVIE